MAEETTATETASAAEVPVATATEPTAAPDTSTAAVAVAEPAAAAATPSAPAEVVNAHFDAFREEVRANVSAQIPTTAHNTLMDILEALRSKILGLF